MKILVVGLLGSVLMVACGKPPCMDVAGEYVQSGQCTDERFILGEKLIVTQDVCNVVVTTTTGLIFEGSLLDDQFVLETNYPLYQFCNGFAKSSSEFAANCVIPSQQSSCQITATRK